MFRGRLLAVGCLLLLLIVASVDALLVLDPGTAATRGVLLASVTGSAHAQRTGTSSLFFDTRAPCDHVVMAGKTDRWSVTAADAVGTPALSATGLPTYGSFTDNRNGTGSLIFRPPVDTAGTDLAITVVASVGGDTASINCTERVIASPRNPPQAVLKVTPSSGRIPLPVTADARDSSGPEGTKIVSYQFDFGNGVVVGPQPDPTATYSYRFTGSYTVTVVVTDLAGLSGRASAPVLVTLPPPAPARTPAATPKPAA